jgi:hypothetical protein
MDCASVYQTWILLYNRAQRLLPAIYPVLCSLLVNPADITYLRARHHGDILPTCHNPLARDRVYMLTLTAAQLIKLIGGVCMFGSWTGMVTRAISCYASLQELLHYRTLSAPRCNVDGIRVLTPLDWWNTGDRPWTRAIHEGSPTKLHHPRLMFRVLSGLGGEHISYSQSWS